jgi:phage tail-like protein
MPARPEDSLVGFQFTLELSGKTQAVFREISGLGSESEVVEEKSIDVKGHPYVKKIPGRLKYTDVTLKRGITAVMDIWQWRKLVEKGDIVAARTNGSIVAYDTSFQEVARWNFENAWPTKITGPQFQADSNNIALEEVTITFEKMERIS